MNKRDFIVNTLLPYKKDPSQCGVTSEGGCSYLTPNGKKCALGKHLKKGDWQNSVMYAESFLSTYGKNVLTEEAQAQNLSSKEWGLIQDYHDKIATREDSLEVDEIVLALEKITDLQFPELFFNN